MIASWLIEYVMVIVMEEEDADCDIDFCGRSLKDPLVSKILLDINSIHFGYK